jgi:hypothetical protein
MSQRGRTHRTRVKVSQSLESLGGNGQKRKLSGGAHRRFSVESELSRLTDFLAGTRHCPRGGARFRDRLSLEMVRLLPGFFLSDAPEFERWSEGDRSRVRLRPQCSTALIRHASLCAKAFCTART